MATSIEILSPAAAAQSESTGASVFSLTSLHGKVVGFVDNAKPNFNHLVDDIAERLISQYEVARVIKLRKRAASIPAPAAELEALAGQCDLVITGSGD
jgi:hypothetical protein